ncbi:hypothetical protein HCN44_001324 [Aphidius gifuensis]|uniref:C-type lectin domain-containing protein n=1 Tax=Aphidius gifuensis TaxID=684658 RepID=A0A834XHL3_APHGI|nr:hemolymph lipopolysaccharide-binding protein-like [Aphidius gifuensis]KAF7987148.1 hypothetical protein HCN44_001324 [Aphidius gifuensis]
MVVTAIPIENTNGESTTVCISTKEFDPQNMTRTGKCSNKYLSKRDDYSYTPGIEYHKLHSKNARFNDARKICIEEGGHLAIINSFAEERVLLGIYARTKTNQDQAYVGIHNFYSSDDWVTIFGDLIYKAGYSEWADSQPNNGDGGGVQNCATLYKTGKLNDVGCTCTFIGPFFCEIPEF